jgi:hypothetical protein
LAHTVLTVLSFLLTLSALAATFAVSNNTSGQSIDKAVAAKNQGSGYPLDKWTPGTWTEALLALPIADAKDADYLEGWLKVMKGNKFNLIPLFLIGLVVAVLSVMAALEDRRMHRGGNGKQEVDGQSSPMAEDRSPI